LLLLIASASLSAQPVRSPSAIPINRADVTELAQFEEGHALAVDPAGAIYVVDRGPEVVVRLQPDGRVTDVLGGSGSAPGLFDGPADIDPTNGLTLVVADAGNSRVQRFSKALRLLEVIPVDRTSTGRLPSYDRRRAATTSPSNGRPVAVAMTSADELVIVDADQNVVLKWEQNRRAQRVIGGYEEGTGTLIEPFALALGPNDELWVADRGHDAVLRYDAFGSFLQMMAPGAIDRAQTIAMMGSNLWVIHPDRILVFNRRGTLQRVYEVRLGEPIVDVARHGRTHYLLTPARLLRWNR
jgi:streptogramin lyase